jgi:tagatose 1,6-diphosphate aldolase
MAVSIGKIRALQLITTHDGIFVICALDHRDSLKQMITQEEPENVGYSELVDKKLELCAALAPHASAILLDPNYGAAQCIAGGALPGHTGLLISMEATGYESSPQGRITSLLKGWSVEKIKRMGGSAVKILVYYRPDLANVTRKQLNTIGTVAKECLKHDIPFIVEPITYATGKENPDSPEYADHKPCLVIKSARQITALPIDVLKAEFPANLKYETDEAKLLALCKQLDEASSVPWVVLSTGVDYETFRKQVKIACQAGASGFMGGRAIWQDALQIKDKGKRVKFLSTTVVDRLKELADIATKHAVPWYRKLGIKANELSAFSENWYRTY